MRHAGVVCALCLALAAGVARAAPGPPSGAVDARVLVSPLSVAVLVPTSPVRAGRSFPIRAEVANTGSSRLGGVAVSLVAPSGLVLRDPVTQVLPRLGAGATQRVRWDACAAATGGYVVMARAVAGPFVAESTGELVEISSAKRPTC